LGFQWRVRTLYCACGPRQEFHSNSPCSWGFYWLLFFSPPGGWLILWLLKFLICFCPFYRDRLNVNDKA
jgi:hypothetical protein